MKPVFNKGSEILILDAQTSGVSVPSANFGSVIHWNGEKATPEFDLHVWAAGSVNLTSAIIYGAIPKPVTIADITLDSVDHTAETLTKTTHGLQTGDGPIQISNSGGALPTGLAASTDYYVIKVDADTIKLALTLADALDGTAVAFSANGSGTNTLADTSDTERLRWMHFGLLGPLRDGAVALTGTVGYVTRVRHDHKCVAYALSASLSGSVATSACIIPVMEI